MPTTPPTIVAPLPHDPRVMALAKALNVSMAVAYYAAAKAWAWMGVMGVGGLVQKTEPSAMDALVEIDGLGAAMLQAGLVGVVDGGLVLPAELRRHERERPAADVRDGDDRRRRQARDRKRRQRAGKKLTTPPSKALTPAPTVEDSAPRLKPRRLGSVNGFPVMLLFSRKGVPFYKLQGAAPQEWTGTVTDQEKPNFADALQALHGTMKRQSGKGFGINHDAMRPDPFPLSVPVLMRVLGNSPRGVSEGGA